MIARREKILEWQRGQEFPICPNPDEVYGNTGEHREEKAQ